MNTIKYKYVEHAYATSPTAIKFGFASTGCWIIQINSPGKVGKAVAAFATLTGAQNAASARPEPWHPIYKQYQPLEAK